MQRPITRGASANSGLIFHIFAQDSTSTSGAGKASVAFGSWTCYYIRSGEAISGAITPQDITTIGTYAAPSANTNIRIKAVDNTNMIGIYEVQIHSDWVNTTNSCQSLTIYLTASGVAVLPIQIPLIAANMQDSVRLGLTALPNAAADAAGGLPISDAGGLDLDAKIGALTYTVANKVDTNMTHIAGSAVSTSSAQLGVNVVNAAGTAWGSGAITAASIATDAITAAKIAADAIGASELAADAVTEIQSGLATAASIAALNNLSAAQVNAECDTALADYGALKPTTAGRTLDVSATGEAGVDWANVGSPTTTVGLTGTTIATSQVVASVSGAVGSVTGAVGSVTGNVGGNVAGSVGSVTGAVGSVTGNVGGNVTGSVGSLATQAKADVNAEVVDALNVDTYAEPAQGTPGATITLAAKIGYLYKFLRNRKTQTATTKSIYNDDATTVDHKCTVADDGTTYSETEMTTGP